jgi:hypothetical protein
MGIGSGLPILVRAVLVISPKVRRFIRTERKSFLELIYEEISEFENGLLAPSLSGLSEDILFERDTLFIDRLLRLARTGIVR